MVQVLSENCGRETMNPPGMRSGRITDRGPLQSLSKRLDALDDNLYQPWHPQTIEFFSQRNLLSDFKPGCDQEAWAKEDFRVLSGLFTHLQSESGVSLQIALPTLCLSFKDRITAALIHQFPHGRTFVRRCSAFAAHTLEQLEKGDKIPAFTEQRKKEAAEMCTSVDAGKFHPGQNICQDITPFRALLQRLHSVRRIWRTYPESIFDVSFAGAQHITIERFHRGRPAPEWALHEAELLQQGWFDKGKRGTGTVFDAAFLQNILNDSGAESSLIRFGYKCDCLGYYYFQPNSEALSQTNRKRLNLLDHGTCLRAKGAKKGWATLCVLNPGTEKADPVKAFERDLDTPAYPFVTSIAQDFGISYGTDLLGGIVRLGNPAASQHALLGFIDARQLIQTSFGDAALIALPTDLPEPLRQSIMLLGSKKPQVKDSRK